VYVPEEESTSVGHAKRWTPFRLKPNLLHLAPLDDKKLDEMDEELQLIKLEVPDAKEWTAKTEEYELTPTHLHRILQTAFKHDDMVPVTFENDMPLLPMPDIADSKSIIFRRATAISRLVGYALRRVLRVSPAFIL